MLFFLTCNLGKLVWIVVMKYAETFALGEISFGRVAELVEQYVVLIFCDLFPQYAGELTPVDSFCLLLMKVLTIFFSFAARKVGLPARFRWAFSSPPHFLLYWFIKLWFGAGRGIERSVVVLTMFQAVRVVEWAKWHISVRPWWP